MSNDRIFELCDVVRETAYGIHRYLGPGFSNGFTRML